MRSPTFPILCLLAGASLLAAPGCATKEPTSQAFPPAADLEVRPKPQLTIEALASEAAMDDHDIALEAWGEQGWRQVGRLCRWAVEMGAVLAFDCPAAAEAGSPGAAARPGG